MKFKWGPALSVIALVILLGVIMIGCTGAGTQGWSGPVVSNGILYMGTLDGKVIALDSSNGVTKWQQPLQTTGGGSSFGCAPNKVGTGIYSTAALTPDAAFFGDSEGSLYALTLGGVTKWSYDTGDPIIGNAVVDNGYVYFGSSNDKVYSLSVDSGQPRWQYKTNGKVWSTPLVADGVVYIGSLDHHLYALDAVSGKKLWSYETKGAIVTTPIIVGDTIYIGANDNHLYALKKTDGSLKWSFKGDNWFWATPAVSGDKIYAVSLSGTVYAIQDVGSQGNELWRFSLTANVSAPPLLLADQNLLLVGDRKGHLQALSLDGIPGWSMAFAAPIYAPLFYDQGNIYIATRDHKVHSVQLNTNKTNWTFDTDKMTLVVG